jgi:hypothetical protein
MLVDELNVRNIRPTSSPCNPKFKLPEENSECIDQSRYRHFIGQLLWIARCTRPDILFTITMLAQFQEDPRIEHLGGVKHLVRFLHGTAHCQLLLNRKTGPLLAAVDSSYGDALLGRYSASGVIILHNESPILFASSKQKCVATSACEAEYVALSDGMKKIIAIRKVYDEIIAEVGLPPQPSMKVFTDSASAIQVIKKGSIYAGKLKHIDVRLTWCTELFDTKEFELEWIKGTSNLADICTKNVQSLPHFLTMQSALLGNSGVEEE